MKYDLLSSGIYTIPDAARLVGVSPARIRGWLRGYPRSKAGPVIQNELDEIEGKYALDFLSLIEVRFISVFSDAFSMPKIREMWRNAVRYLEREHGLNTLHPFATEYVFETDAQSVYLKETAPGQDEPRIYNLKNRMMAFWPILQKELRPAIRYEEGVARSWHPARGIAPNVVIDPIYAFGQPIVQDYKVPTRALYDSYRAEAENADIVADWFEVDKELVLEAVRFEREVYQAHAA